MYANMASLNGFRRSRGFSKLENLVRRVKLTKQTHLYCAHTVVKPVIPIIYHPLSSPPIRSLMVSCFEKYLLYNTCSTSNKLDLPCRLYRTMLCSSRTRGIHSRISSGLG
jgi:hypothetical protein